MLYRVKFTKEGPLKYTGHLDVMRFFQRVIRRAELPVAYSEGYSPHQILSFAFPLSVGFTSEAEYFDVEMTDRVEEEEILRLLNENSVPFIRILQVRELPEKAKNCMSIVFASAYEVTFRDNVPLPPDYASKWAEFFERDSILLQKPKKKGGGFLEIDLKDYVYARSVPEGKQRTIAFTVNSSSSGNIRPGFVAESFLSYLCIEIPEHAYLVHRTEIYENAGTDDKIILKPLLTGE